MQNSKSITFLKKLYQIFICFNSIRHCGSKSPLNSIVIRFVDVWNNLKMQKQNVGGNKTKLWENVNLLIFNITHVEHEFGGLHFRLVRFIPHVDDFLDASLNDQFRAFVARKQGGVQNAAFDVGGILVHNCWKEKFMLWFLEAPHIPSMLKKKLRVMIYRT